MPRNRDHVFFPAMSVIIGVVVFIGFSRTYFLASVFHAKPLAAPIVHVHGAVFSAWIVLLITQTTLVRAGRTDLHRTLGLFASGLALLVFILGVLVAVEMLNRTWSIPGFASPVIFAVALSEIFGFAVPTFAAFWMRRRSAFHKRLILIGSIAMTTAGFGRWPVAFLLHKPLPAMLAAFTLLALVVIYDLVMMRRVHRATALGVAWVVSIELAAVVVGPTVPWQKFAADLHSFTTR